MSDSEEEITERQFKICLIGDTQAGKTSIASRYATDNFGKFPSTVGVEFYLKRTVLPGPRHITLKVRKFSTNFFSKHLNANSNRQSVPLRKTILPNVCVR